jgi:hypothetical protein
MAAILQTLEAVLDARQLEMFPAMAAREEWRGARSATESPPQDVG